VRWIRALRTIELVTNVGWIAALTLLVLIEKAPAGEAIRNIGGVVLLLWAVPRSWCKEIHAMAWRLAGRYMENCNCDTVCPCTTSESTRAADRERCMVFLVFHIDDGEIEGVPMRDRNVAAIFDAPPVMSEGGWSGGLILDASASTAEAERLERVFKGELGGPPSAFGALVGNYGRTVRAAIRYTDREHRHGVVIGEDVDIEIEDFVSPETGEVLEITGLGFPAPALTVATATRSRFDRYFGFRFSHDGKNGHWGRFSWSS
jgi:hypothetical protein